MATIGPFQRTSNSQSDGIVHAHALRGEHVAGAGGVHHSHDTIQQVPPGTNFMSEYVPPKRRDRDNPDKVLCSMEGCKAFPIKSTHYCAGHSRSLGLVDWPKGGHHKKDVPDEAE